MKMATSIVMALVFTLSLATAAFAAEHMRGTIKAVNEQAGTVTFCPEGTTSHHVMEVGKDVDIKNIKPDTKVEISVEDNKVTHVKIEKKRMMIEGC